MDKLKIVRYDARKHRRQTSDLLFFSRLNQVHLDWYDADNWLGSDDALMMLAWQGGEMVGALGTSRPLYGASWVRLVAIEAAEPYPVLAALWAELALVLRQADTQQVCWLVVENWMAQHLPRLGFAYHDEIITLRRTGYDLPAVRLAPRLRLRAAERDDLDRLTEVDQTAFAPPWQLTRDDLLHARRIAASCTVAELEGEIVGYQLSTRYHQTGHLARLAVLPGYQGRQIGAGLLADLTSHFLRRQIRTLTVNTQASNLRSQKLYTWFGFSRTGFDLPVWHTML